MRYEYSEDDDGRVGNDDYDRPIIPIFLLF